MEALRRARFVWAILCMLVAGGLALVQAFAPQPNALFITVLLWSGVWLWMPLYMRWSPTTKAAAVWFLGAMPLNLLANDPRAGIAVSIAAGVVVCAVVWIALGLRGRNT